MRQRRDSRTGAPFNYGISALGAKKVLSPAAVRLGGTPQGVTSTTTSSVKVVSSEPIAGYLLAAAAVLLTIAYAVIARRVPLERADPHAGESIFRSVSRHYRRLRGRGQ